MFGGSSFFEPRSELGESGWATFLKLLAANGGHPQMGKELKRAFLDAGFVDVAATASFEPYSSDDDLAFLRGMITGWFFAPKTMGAAIQHGLASEEQFDRWRRSLDEWVDEPGAFAGFAWGEAIGRKP